MISAKQALKISNETNKCTPASRELNRINFEIQALANSGYKVYYDQYLLEETVTELRGLGYSVTYDVNRSPICTYEVKWDQPVESAIVRLDITGSAIELQEKIRSNTHDRQISVEYSADESIIVVTTDWNDENLIYELVPSTYDGFHVKIRLR